MIRAVLAFVALSLLTACSVPEQIVFMFRHHGATPAEEAKALDVAWCESRWDPRATNGPHVGAFQINWNLHRRLIEAWGLTRDDMFNPTWNAYVASRMWLESGRSWRAWTCA